MYSFDGKASASHDLSNVSLICWFNKQSFFQCENRETFCSFINRKGFF